MEALSKNRIWVWLWVSVTPQSYSKSRRCARPDRLHIEFVLLIAETSVQRLHSQHRPIIDLDGQWSCPSSGGSS